VLLVTCVLARSVGENWCKKRSSRRAGLNINISGSYYINTFENGIWIGWRVDWSCTQTILLQMPKNIVYEKEPLSVLQ
jgi:hypothetical protein